MARLTLLAAVLAVGAATALAAGPLDSCGSKTYASLPTLSSSWACFADSAADDKTTTFELTVPGSVPDGSALVIAVLNHKYSKKGGWRAATPSVLTSTTNLGVRAPGIDQSLDTQPVGLPFSVQLASDKDGVQFGVMAVVTTPCAGKYTVTFDNPGGTDPTQFVLAAALRPEGDVNYQLLQGNTPWLEALTVSTSGSTATLTGQILKGALTAAGGSNVVVPINAAWSTQGYLAASVSVAAHAVDSDFNDKDILSWNVDVTARDNAGSQALAARASNALNNAPGGYTDRQITRTDDGVSRTFRGVGPRGGGLSQNNYRGAGARVTLPPLAAFTHDWSSGSPATLYFDFTVTVSWSEYGPPAAGNIDVESEPGGDRRSGGADDPQEPPEIQERIYMLDMSSQAWFAVEASFGGLLDSPDVSFGTSLDGATATSIGNGFTYTDTNGALLGTLIAPYINIGGGGGQPYYGPINPSTLVYFGVDATPVMPKLFVKVRRGGCLDAAFSWSSLSVNVKYVTGECTSYRDCYDPQDGHPSAESDRDDISANGDASRFVHCLAAVSGLGTPDAAFVTQCSECTSDCDCNGGQYCHLDLGWCDGTGVASGGFAPYVCDPQSNKKFGTCQAKDTDVLGGRCRAGASAAPGGYLGSTTNYATASWLNAVSSLVTYVPSTDGDDPNDPTSEDFDSGDGANNGYGFCGEARYWNSTNTGSNVAAVSYAARTTLWTGTCYNFECRECTEGISMCNSNRQCIDGRWQDRITVDGTQRTYTHNAVAGTLLGLTFMVILLQICVAANVYFAKDLAAGPVQYTKNPAAATAGGGVQA